MQEPKRERKGDIKAINQVQLNDEQKEAKRLIIANQIVIITGVAGTGKSLVCAQASLDFYAKKQVTKIIITRPAIEVGRSLGFLPGDLAEKFDPYLEGFMENLCKCADPRMIDAMIKDNVIRSMPVQFARSKTIDDILIIEEAQNLTKHEMLALLTRLGKTGKMIINGDNEQKDTREEVTGLSYAIELSKKIEEIQWVKLKHNHRSDLVGKILDYEYGR